MDITFRSKLNNFDYYDAGNTIKNPSNLGNPLPQNGQNLRYPSIGPFYKFSSASFAVGVIEGHLQGLALDADGGVGGGMRDRVGPEEQFEVD